MVMFDVLIFLFLDVMYVYVFVLQFKSDYLILFGAGLLPEDKAALAV